MQSRERKGWEYVWDKIVGCLPKMELTRCWDTTGYLRLISCFARAKMKQDE